MSAHIGDGEMSAEERARLEGIAARCFGGGMAYFERLAAEERARMDAEADEFLEAIEHAPSTPGRVVLGQRVRLGQKIMDNITREGEDYTRRGEE